MTGTINLNENRKFDLVVLQKKDFDLNCIEIGLSHRRGIEIAFGLTFDWKKD